MSKKLADSGVKSANFMYADRNEKYDENTVIGIALRNC